MKLSLEPTDTVVVRNGVHMRIWKGTTDRGTPVHAYIVCTAVPTDSPEECERFARELKEIPGQPLDGMIVSQRFIG